LAFMGLFWSVKAFPRRGRQSYDHKVPVPEET
jgi:hypothetical protein